MNILNRQEALVSFLRREGFVTIERIVFELGVSRRTALRDIAALREQGFIISSNSGKGGGVYLEPSSIQYSAKLTGEEMFSLIISISVMQSIGYLPFERLASQALRKIEKGLPKQRVTDLRKLLGCLYIGSPASIELVSGVAKVDEKIFPTFEKSFLNSWCLAFTYKNRQGVSSERLVEPHAVLILQPIWYIVGFDTVKNDFRHFRMDRIDAPETIEQRFTRKNFKFDEDVCPFSTAINQR